ALRRLGDLLDDVTGNVVSQDVDVYDERRGSPPVVVAQAATPDERDPEEPTGAALGSGAFRGRRHRGHGAGGVEPLHEGRFRMGSSTSVRRGGGPVIGA